MTINIISEPVLQMLAAFERVLKKLNIDFYLVGALARDIGLSVNPRLAPKRKTNDVDIAIFVASEQQFCQVKEALMANGEFAAHETESIKLFYKGAIELDLLPFGDIENKERETRLKQPRLFVMDVPGFREVFPDAEQYKLNDEVTLKVCPLEGIVLLKLIANDDKPERTKDIADIEYIISVYFGLKDMEIYEDQFDLLDIYNTDDPNYMNLISARVVGRKIGHMLRESEKLRERLLSILNRKTTGVHWPEIATGITDAVSQ